MSDVSKEHNLESDIEIGIAQKTFRNYITIKEHWRHKDEVIIQWHLEEIDDDNGDDLNKSRCLRINKKELPKLIKALKAFEDT